MLGRPSHGCVRGWVGSTRPTVSRADWCADWCQCARCARWCSQCDSDACHRARACPQAHWRAGIFVPTVPMCTGTARKVSRSSIARFNSSSMRSYARSIEASSFASNSGSSGSRTSADFRDALRARALGVLLLACPAGFMRPPEARIVRGVRACRGPFRVRGCGSCGGSRNTSNPRLP